MNKSTEYLFGVWQVCHDLPAWLSIASDMLDLSQEDDNYLADLDDYWRETIRKCETFYRERYSVTGIDAPDGSEWAKERRTEYLKSQILKISTRMREDSEEYYRLCAADAPLFDRLFLRSCSPISSPKDNRKKLYWEIRSLQTPEMRGELTDVMIERARNFPLEKLVEPIRGYIKCPFHDDKKPSMWVKDGFGFCFPCDKSLDAIGYMMQIKGLSFPDAVKALQ